MTEFVVRVANRPGRLAALAEAVAEAGVNIESLAAFSHDDTAVVRMIVDDPRRTHRVLTEAGIPFEEHRIRERAATVERRNRRGGKKPPWH